MRVDEMIDTDTHGPQDEFEAVVPELRAAYADAVRRHPASWAASYAPVGQVSLIAEELLELVQAANDMMEHGSSEELMQSMLQEAMHVAATAVRFVIENRRT